MEIKTTATLIIYLNTQLSRFVSSYERGNTEKIHRKKNVFLINKIQIIQIKIIMKHNLTYLANYFIFSSNNNNWFLIVSQEMGSFLGLNQL